MSKALKCATQYRQIARKKPGSKIKSHHSKKCMKSLISLIVYTILSLAVCAQNKGLAGKPDSSKK